MTKAELRKQYLHERLAFNDADLADLNTRLCDNFFSTLPVGGIRVLHAFIPMENTREPDTWLILDRVQAEFPEVRISIPKINVETREVENFYFEGRHQLKSNPWGIPEPEFGERTNNEDIDMVLVPMMIADRAGNRVGYGKGFYDKFLATCKPLCLTVGLCFFEPVKKIDDVNSLDVPLKYCVTPAKVHHFSN